MAVRIDPIDAGDNAGDAIHVVVAGYRSRPNPLFVRAAKLNGPSYGVLWAAGSWAEASPSIGVIARGARVAVPALKTGRTLACVGSLAGGLGAAALIGTAQFRHRYYCARRDGELLADEIAKLPDVGTRPLHLIGHSLGTVVIRSALAKLAERDCRVHDILLMGGMTSRMGWESHGELFTGRLINLYSPWDRVLNVSPVFDRVVGTGEITCRDLKDRLVNHDLRRALPNQFNVLAHHSGYWKNFGTYIDQTRG